MSRRGRHAPQGTTKFTTHTVDGVAFEIQVTAEGRFGTTHDGEWVERKTLPDLKGYLRELVRSATGVVVQATQIEHEDSEDGPDFTDVEIVWMDTRGPVWHAIEAGMDGPMRGRRQIGGYHAFYRRLTPEERTDFQALCKAFSDARMTVQAWMDHRQMDPEEALTQARAAQPPSEEPLA